MLFILTLHLASVSSFHQKKSEADAAKALKKQHEMDVHSVTLHTLSDQIQCHHCAAMYWREEAPGKVTPCCKSGDMIIPLQHFPPMPTALLTHAVALHRVCISNARLLNQYLCFSAMGTTPIASAGGLGFYTFKAPHCVRCNGMVRMHHH